MTRWIQLNTQNERSFRSGVKLVNTVNHIVGNIVAQEVVVLLNYKTHN